MKIAFRRKDEDLIESDALILPVFEGEADMYRSIDEKTGWALRKAMKSGEFRAKHLDTCIIHTHGRIRPDRVLLIGLGDRKGFNEERLRQSGGRVASISIKNGYRTLTLSTTLIRDSGKDPLHMIEGLLLGSYRFTRYKKNEDKSAIKTIIIPEKKESGTGKVLNFLLAVSESVSFVRDLVNTPSNNKPPSFIASSARRLKDRNTTVKVLSMRDAERAGMEAFLSVSRGSSKEPRFIVIEYKGGNKGPVVLIGKSVTFDSGGISLKPSEGMEKMKYDMAGGAAVMGAIKAASRLGLPVHMIGILPATENMPGGSATRPGDVVKTLKGKSVEIINTDAEGRLTLADAIGYAGRFKPDAIVDIATLTGACTVALGSEAIAMMGNSEKILGMMRTASERSGERVWLMPLYEEYKEYLKSDIADIKNTGGREGSLVTAAYFLKEFAGDTPWVHLDIASTAWTEKDRPYTPKGASGIGVRLLINFIKEYIS